MDIKSEIFPIGYIKRIKGKIFLDILKPFIPGLKQIEHFSHIRVFWWIKNEEKINNFKLLQNTPSYKNASQSYIHPNPIGLTTTKILDVDYNKGIIEIDFIDGNDETPIIDIKTYIPLEDRVKNVKVPEWLSDLPKWRSEDSTIKTIYTDNICSTGSINQGSSQVLKYRKEQEVFNIFPIGSIKKNSGKTYLEILDLYKPVLKELEYFGHVQVLWWFDRFQSDRFRRTTQVSPPYEKAPITGVFACRSPVRPNTIALDTVKVLNIDHQKGIIEIDSIEAYSKTPFLDLKAYFPFYDRVKDFKVPQWISYWPEWKSEREDTELADIISLRNAAIDSICAFQPVLPENNKKTQSKNNYNNLSAELEKQTDVIISGKPDDFSDIIVRGARQNNLKDIDVKIPCLKFTVITGVSGSGKSSLAFDTLHAEGQYRYINSLSSRASQFIDQLEKPDVDDIIGLNPTIAIEQKTITRNPRSTVGTITGITDYLRVLFARIGTFHCPKCGRAIKPQTASQITDKLITLAPGTSFKLLVPIVKKGKGKSIDILKQYINDGFNSFRIDGKVFEKITNKTILQLKKIESHNIELIIKCFTIPDKDTFSKEKFYKQLLASIENTFEMGNGLLIISFEDEEDILVSKYNVCPYCDTIFFEISPTLFSFNSPDGMCSDCNGLGVKLSVDPNMIITNPEISLLDGASLWYGNLRQKEISANWMIGELFALAEKYKVDLEFPWKRLPEKFRDAVLYGSRGEKLSFRYQSKRIGRSGEIVREAQGVVNNINRLFRQTKGESSQNFYLQFMSEKPCPTCNGERLCQEACLVTVGDSRFPEITKLTIAQVQQWITNLPQKLTSEQLEIAGEILRRLKIRIKFLLNVGLYYLTLDRSASSLSGGEGQRIRLATQLGGGLNGLFYILDEPSIGLHPRDHKILLSALIRLRDEGNTVLVVEHDADTIRAADYLIDLGPGAGILGGNLVAAGTIKEVMNNPNSLTGRYLNGKLKVTSPRSKRKRKPSGWLTITRARLHNLKNINVHFPLSMFISITGVSGSGKSSLVSQTLYPGIYYALKGGQPIHGCYDRIEGLDKIDKVINITQSSIGRTHRSNPATYVGVFDEIRKVFANTTDSKENGFGANRFSFNSEGGRCEVCQGQGKNKIKMHFLPDVWVTCKECNGKRFNHQTLEIKYKGKSIADILEMDVKEALNFFTRYSRIKRILETLNDVGLGYIKLGQSALTLSGGEAQRIKLAKELSLISTGRTLYILDEPTTGLHFADIQKLLDVLNRLVEKGNTVIVIEHNLDVIKTADWIIDLGPEGGDGGGNIVVQGTPEEIIKVKESYTGKHLREILK